MDMHRFSSLLADLDREPPIAAPSNSSNGLMVLPASSLGNLTPEQVESAQQLHRMAFERAMQSLTPPPAPRGLFDSLN